MTFVPPSSPPPPSVLAPPPPPQPSSVPAGWYHDPAGSANMRWWDGYRWSDHLAPANAVGIGAKDDSWTALDYLVPTARNSASRALFWGIFAQFANIVFLIPGIIAIISGAIGLSRANRLAREGLPPKGRGLSIAGLVLGIVATITTVAGVVVIISLSRGYSS